MTSPVPLDISAILANVNEKRKMHRSPPLEWSPEISRLSQEWAERGKFEHSKRPGLSENLFMFNSADPSFRKAVSSWYNESRFYDFNHPGFSPTTGHFSALVWKSSTKVGAGAAKLPNGMYLYVMNLSPAGNLNSPKMFTLNVTPAVQEPR